MASAKRPRASLGGVPVSLNPSFGAETWIWGGEIQVWLRCGTIRGSEYALRRCDMSDLTTLTDRMAREPGQWVHLIRFALETLLEPAAETLRGLRIQAEDGEEFFESPRHLVNAFEDVVRLAERRSGR